MSGRDYAAKIGKLLAMAEGTDNPSEAEAFMAKAEALMIEQGITEAVARTAAGASVSAEQIVERAVSLYVPPATKTWTQDDDASTYTCAGCDLTLTASKFPTTKHRGEREVECRRCRDARYAAGEPRPRETMAYNTMHMAGFNEVVRALGLRAYRRGTTSFHIVGFERDAARAETLVRSLHVQVVAAMWRWWRTTGRHEHAASWSAMGQQERTKARKAFVVSFYVGAARRILSERTTQVEATAGAALAVRDREQLVADHVDAMNLAKGRATDVGFSAAGMRAGMAANVGTTAAPGGRTAIGVYGG